MVGKVRGRRETGGNEDATKKSGLISRKVARDL